MKSGRLSQVGLLTDAVRRGVFSQKEESEEVDVVHGASHGLLVQVQ